MGSDYLAAKLDDPLVHSSWFADFMGGVVKGAIYAAVGIGMVALLGPVGGFLAVMAFGFIFGEAVDALADLGSDISDAILDFLGLKGPPDGIITSGSPDVRTKGKPAARAAGKIPAEVIRAELEAERENPSPQYPKPLAIAGRTLERAASLASLVTGITAGKAIAGWLMGDKEKEPPADPDAPKPIPSPKSPLWQSVISPVVAAKHPYASPEDHDTIACKKGHVFSGNGLYLAEGSKKVFINSQPACRNDDRSTCEAKIKHEQQGARVRIGGPTVTVRDIHSGKNPLAAFMGEIVGSLGVAMVASGGRMCTRSLACALAGEVGSALLGYAAGMLGEGAARIFSEATSRGHPVHIPTGAKILAGEEECDFTLDGRLPLIWQRLYNSRNDAAGALGRGWALPHEYFLTLAPVADEPSAMEATFTDRSGRALGLGALARGQGVHYPDEGFRLWRSLQDVYMLEDDGGLYSVFEPDPQAAGRLRLAQQLDRHGYALLYRYNHAGQLTAIHDDAYEVSLRLHWHPTLNRLTEVWQLTDSGERQLVSYGYDAAGNLAAVTDADGYVIRRFDYHPAHGCMTAHRYAGGLSAHYRWRRLPVFNAQVQGEEEAWYVTQHWLEESGRALEYYEFDYCPQEYRASVTRRDHGTTHHCWDRLGQVTDYTDETGSRWRFDRDDASNLISLITPTGDEFRLKYDERSNPIAWINPLGEKETQTWVEDLSLPVLHTFADGTQEYREYNEQGDLTALRDREGGLTRFCYDGQGNLVRILDAAGNETRLEYNSRGQVIKRFDCSGYLTRIFYDELGRVERISDAAGRDLSWQRSAAGRLLAETLPGGGRREYGRDAAGRLSQVRDEGGRISRFTRNGRGQVTELVRPDGTRLRCDYDDAGLPAVLFNEKGAAWYFRHDVRGRLTEETDWSGQRRTWRYDAQGRPVETVHYPYPGAEDEPPLTTRLTWDALDRLTGKTTARHHTRYDHQSGTVTVERFALTEWQQAQREGRAARSQERLAFTYSPQGRMTAEEGRGGRIRHRYDVLGNLLETQLPDGERLAYHYYGSGHLQQLDLLAAGERHVIAEYGRDRLHRETARSQGELWQHVVYDAVGRVTEKRMSANESASSTALAEMRFGWDAAGNLLQRRWQARSGAAGHYTDQREAQYRYDRRDHLLSAQDEEGTRRWHYDAAGSLLAQADENILHNRPGHSGTARCRYDGFGRLAERRDKRQGRTERFYYDDEHRLVRVAFSGHPDYREARYRYDALGRRTAKTLTRHDGREEETEFLWCGLRLYGERNGDATETGTLYFYNEGGHEPIARAERQKGGYRLYWYRTALNGLPESLHDKAGRAVWRGRCDEWGALKQESYTGEGEKLRQNLRFAGQYFDHETGLHYTTFRYYDPENGHFTQPDPIGLAGGLNQYAYAPNALTWIDPLGLASTNNPGVYDVHGEAHLPSDMYRMSDGKHFQEANRQLYYQMKNDPQFKATLEGKYPGIFEKVSPGKRGAFPRKAPTGIGWETTWHHHERVAGLLQLVDGPDHN
ncbi:RHS repeat-associated core domain-containing protein [Mixta tenebrionis]|uniref:RHS repeat-associated core domain-containing protein n=1 Tax=Mixta tenebrionis TaxID=2562439 RepID=UPI00363294A2